MIDPNAFQSMIGKRIAALRSEQGITQRDLALMAGINRGYLCDLEHGKANPTLSMLVQIADALQVDAPDLLALPDQPDKDEQ